MRARRWVTGAIAVATVIAGSANAVADPAKAPESGCGTAVMNGVLNAVVALSPSDAWAVGDHGNVNRSRTLIEHWNGNAWCTVKSPDPASGENVLNAVAAASPSDIWAVGYSVSRVPHEHTLMLHWNGIRWSTVPSPDPSQLFGNQLAAVTAFSAKNAWAAGSYVSKSHFERNLVMRWNGQRWRQEPIASRGRLGDGIDTLTATSRSNVLALGHQDDATFTAKAVALQWNGRTWRRMSGLRLGGAREGGYLTGARAFSRANAWAVGHYFTTSTLQSLIEHWNGRTWTRVAHPNPSRGQNFSFLGGIAGTSPSDLWAVGSYQVNLLDQTLIEHWHGKAWATVPSPDPAGAALNNILTAAAAASSTDVWAVGFSTDGTSSRTMILHWSGAAWTPVRSP